MEPVGEDQPIPSLTQLAVRLGLGLLTLAAAIVGLATVFRGPLEAFAAWFVGELGLVGVAALVMVVDTMPLTHEPILLLAWSGGLGFWPIWAAASAGSVASGAVGWGLGRLLGSRWGMLQSLFERAHVKSFLTRYGAWAVAVAAFTPFPFSLTTWCSGACGVPLRPVLLGSLFRAPKVLLYLTIIVYGWELPSIFGNG